MTLRAAWGNKKQDWSRVRRSSVWHSSQLSVEEHLEFVLLAKNQVSLNRNNFEGTTREF